MSSDQVSYTTTEVVLDGLAEVTIGAVDTKPYGMDEGSPSKRVQVIIHDYEGKIAYELWIKADEINIHEEG